jgi:VWFA-related protein
MKYRSARARRGAFILTVIALFFAALAPLEPAAAQSGRKVPEKARKAQPAPSAPERQAPGEAPAPAESPSAPEVPPLTADDLQDAVKLTANVVNVETVVYEKKGGKILRDLKASNFEIYEDGVKQEITNFLPTEGPMTLAIVIEYSRRIDGRYIGKAEVLQPLYSLLSQFVRDDDQIAIIAYDIRPAVVADFTNNKQILSAAFNLLARAFPAFNESNMYDALALVLRGGKADTIDFQGSGETIPGVEYAGLKEVESRTAVLLVSIGIDTFSKINYDEIRKIIADVGVPIYTVGVGNYFYKRAEPYMSAEARLDWLQGFNTLRSFSKMSGGQYFPVTFPAEIPTVMQSITNLMRSQYSIGYTPSNTRHEGKTRKIEVKVDVDGDGKFGDKGYEVQHRESYVEPKDNGK